MEKLYQLPKLKSVKGKYKVDTLVPMAHEVFHGELNNGKYYVLIGCINKTIKVKISETEYGLHQIRALNIGKVNNRYASLNYLVVPPSDCSIKLVLDFLEWEYDDADIWC